MSKLFAHCLILCAVLHVGRGHCFLGKFAKRAMPALTVASCIAACHSGSFDKASFKPGIKQSVMRPAQQKDPEYPIVFHPSYDISLLFGIERWLHPFDGQKYGKIARYLRSNLQISRFHEPKPVDDATLATVHSVDYVKEISHNKSLIERVAEVPGLSSLPNWILQRNLMKPVRLGTAGTIMAAELAMKHGWAINLSGGYHHAKAERGEGFCFFADIPLAIKKLRAKNPQLKVLVVDLDAHRGNGIEKIIASDKLTQVFDMYSYPNYPGLALSDERVDFAYPLHHGIRDEEYLTCLREKLPKAIESANPDIIFFNAGSDIYEGDALGHMSVSAKGIEEREEIVFKQALSRKIPICMTLSGGYSKESHAIVSASIKRVVENLQLPKTVQKNAGHLQCEI